MPSLLDTSAISNLIKCGTFDLALKTLGVAHADIEILNETYYVAECNKDRRQQPIFDEAQRKMCLDFCGKVGRIKSPWASTEENVALTKKRFDLRHNMRPVAVDGGEAQIFGYTHKLTDFTIWTADNKCLIALSMIPECKHVHQRVVGHVYCLERILREMIDAVGYDAVAPHIVGCNREITDAIAGGKAKCSGLLKDAEDRLQIDCKGLLVA